MSRGLVKVAVGALLLAAAGTAVTYWLNVRGDFQTGGPAAPADSPQLIARGEYLARAGDCLACHSAAGKPAWSGGVTLETPFGNVYSSNLTPDRGTGIGGWTRDDFWRAMHNGRSRDGRLLYPAFPYTSYTQVTRADSDAIHAYLMQQPAVVQANRPNDLRWPYGTQAALAGWRALFFTPGAFQAETAKTAEWNRGAYLVRGLGHCAACHAPRNAFGATDGELDLAGGLIPVQNWYAPSLALDTEAGVAGWDRRHVVELLKTGVTDQATVSGPMAEAVNRSTQYLDDADLHAMAAYLQDLPERRAGPTPGVSTGNTGPQTLGASGRRGQGIYEKHCASCHGEQGQGVPRAYPALAGNRAVLLDSPANLVQMVLHGGFAAATAGNPRPFGMPPYALALTEREIADVLTYVRAAWGNRAADVTEVDVNRLRRRD